MTGTLEGHWVLDEESGATAYDYSGNENHGSISGAGPQGTGTVTGPFGNSAYDFDGGDDQIDCGNSESLNINGPFTISAWVNPDTWSDPRILREAGDDYGLGGTSGNYRFFYKDSADNFYDVQYGTVTTGSWHHIVGVADLSEGMKLYKNGLLVAGNTVTATPSSDADNTFISDDPYDGKLSDVRLYSRALSPQEVQYLYQAGVRSELTFDQI